jgi:ubiquitin C-terminal hydrolase
MADLKSSTSFERGITNIGNSCYANSALVCLLKYKPVVEFLHKTRSEAFLKMDIKQLRLLRLLSKLYEMCSSDGNKKGETLVNQDNLCYLTKGFYRNQKLHVVNND